MRVRTWLSAPHAGTDGPGASSGRKGREVLAQLIEDTVEVGAIGVTCLAEARAGQAGVQLKALGLVAVANGLD